MDDLLDIYFKKARESLSEPVPISEIRNKIKASPAKPVSKLTIPRKIQVLLVLAVGFAGALLFMQYGISTEEKVDETIIDNEAPKEEGIVPVQEEPPSQENAIIQPEEIHSEEAAPEVVSKGMRKHIHDEVLPMQDDNATSDPQPSTAADPESTTTPPEDSPPPSDPNEDMEPTDPGNSAASNPVDDPKGEEPPKDPPPDETTAPPPVDPNKVTPYTFEFPSTATDRDIANLNKQLRKYGVKFNVTTIERDREWISKLKGDLTVIKTNRKAKIVIGSSNFEKVVITFEHSKNGGADKPDIYAQQ